LDGQRIPFTVELDDAVAFGALVCFAVGGGKLDESGVNHLGRHITSDFFLDTAQNTVARQIGEEFRRRVGGNAFGIDEGENIDEVGGAVFNGRAGHRPTAVAGNAAGDLGCLRFAI